jgi:Holliday junction resolvasome RuvABC endonuclease subunit
MKVAGVDYSMSCPAITVITDSDTDFRNCQVYYMLDSNKYTGKFGNLTGVLPPSHKVQIERFLHISEWAINILKGCDFVGMEDYAMGAKGKVFHIAENTGLLKYFCYKNKIPLELFAPTAVKKFATGKGNADKQKMYDHFLKETNVDLVKELSYEKQLGNPVTDIVDSYYIARMALIQHSSKRNSNVKENQE